MATEAHPRLWDVHVHLAVFDDPESVVLAALERGFGLVGVTESGVEAEAGLRLRALNPAGVRCFLGVHPSRAEEVGVAGVDSLSRHWDMADGVGEAGLDPKYSEVSPKSAQMQVFKTQVEVASRTRKPLQVHSRGAEQECLDVLGGYSLPSVLLHWFEGEERLSRALSGGGRFVSFGPAILYSKKLVRMASRCPEDAVLAESDGPVSFEALGGAGGPGLVPSVAFKLAEIWGRSFEETVERLSRNAQRFLAQEG